MNNLNLISAEQRQYLENRRMKLALERLFILLFLFVFSASLGLGFGKYLLANNYQQLLSYKSADTFSNVDRDINELNNVIKLISRIQSDYSPIAHNLDFFASTVPANIFITNLYLDKKTEKGESFWSIVISGRAKTREDLIKFKSNLEQSNGFSEIESPISNLLKKTDIDFQLKAKLKES